MKVMMAYEHRARSHRGVLFRLLCVCVCLLGLLKLCTCFATTGPQALGIGRCLAVILAARGIVACIYTHTHTCRQTRTFAECCKSQLLVLPGSLRPDLT